LLPVQRQPTLMFRMIRATASPLLFSLFSIEVHGRENIPRSGNYVLIANHLNWLDSFAILAVFPAAPRVHFLGDTTGLVQHRVQWALVKGVAGFIPVNRRLHPDVVLFHHANLCLQRGGVLALYPEGHYGDKEGELQPFKSGFAHFALDNKVPVLPVGLSGTKDLWLRKRVRMNIGRPIETGGLAVDSLVAQAESALRSLLPTYRDAGGRKLFRSQLTHLF
jgi:1-acyl-sn-glycerol-3-phosphate acyltransferase